MMMFSCSCCDLLLIIIHPIIEHANMQISRHMVMLICSDNVANRNMTLSHLGHGVKGCCCPYTVGIATMRYFSECKTADYLPDITGCA